MRQGSSCRTWEPARCSTYSRSNSEQDFGTLKASAYTSNTTSKQHCNTRPPVRQWTSWAGNNTDLGYGQLPKSKPVSGGALTLPQDTSSCASNPLDNIRALPSRPKLSSGNETNKQAQCAVEENKLRFATKTQSEIVGCNAAQFGRPAPSVEVNVARSRCHPRRRPCADALSATTPKLRRDTDCTESIVRLIVFFSTKLVHTIWSQASATPKTSKDFNGAGVLPLQVFIQETLRRSKTSYSTLQVALYYLILLRPHVKPCQASQQQYTPGCRALQCGRRMFLTALILASKYLQDRNYSARAWSKISGLPVAEINENERHYLELIKYNLHMSKESFENWSRVVLTICKASGQGPFGSKQDSPPSSPDSLSFSSDFERPGSSGWWSYHLSRLSPDMVRDLKVTEDYLAGLATKASFIQPRVSLDTPPSSPESLEEMLAEQNTPIVLPASGTAQSVTSVENTAPVQSPTPVGSVPSRPLPPNLPTPQTTPRYDSAFTFSRRPSQSDLRCRPSLHALANVDRQAIHAANLETCPPPRPRHCGTPTNVGAHPLKESIESTGVAWMSSPESSFSDSSSTTRSRSRSSSVSSVSSVWSVPGHCARSNDKPVSVPRMEGMPSCLAQQSQSRANIGSYSFYHPVGDMDSIPEDAKVNGFVSKISTKSQPSCPYVSCADSYKSSGKSEDLSEDQIAQLLASLNSQSDSHVQQRSDSAAIRPSVASTSTQSDSDIIKKHKRSRSSKEESVLHDEVRQFLLNEQIDVCVEDDKRPTSYVETSDKQAQYPMQLWAHAKKPVPNALHNKRIALSHPSSPERRNASELAADFLRHSVAVM